MNKTICNHIRCKKEGKYLNGKDIYCKKHEEIMRGLHTQYKKTNDEGKLELEVFLRDEYQQRMRKGQDEGHKKWIKMIKGTIKMLKKEKRLLRKMNRERKYDDVYIPSTNNCNCSWGDDCTHNVKLWGEQ